MAGEVVRFTFDGRSHQAYAGETIAAALAADGVVALRRARPASAGEEPDWRGLYCGMGACFDCVVTVDGRAGQRACLTKIRGGEIVRSTPPAGTASDPLHALAATPARDALEERFTDVLVVGAGPAGLAAALAAHRCGAQVVVLDERPESGGQYYKPIAASHEASVPPDVQFAAGEALVRSVREAGVEVIQGATVWGAFALDEVLALVGGATAVVFRPRRLILATGAFERAVPIRGWTLPGVMTTGAAQTLLRAYQVAPGSRVVVAGNGPLGFQLAADMAAHGIEVAAVVESAPRPGLRDVATLCRAFARDAAKMLQGVGYLLRLGTGRIPVLWSHVVVEALGRGRLSSVRIAPLAPDGSPRGTGVRALSADTLCLGHGLVASCEIANALGCRMRLDRRHVGTFHVETSETGETSVPGVFAVGDGAFVAGAAVAEAAGSIAGAAAAAQLGLTAPAGLSRRARRRLGRAQAFQDALWALFQAPPVALDRLDDDIVLCRCEGLDVGRIRRHIEAGAASLGVLKRCTRLGMGRCQGRYCAPLAARLLASLTGRERTTDDAFAPRLPAKPFPAAALAIEKPEWSGHHRAASPNLARPLPAEPFGTETADVVIVGGGVVGACLAHELARSGRDTLVVERDDANLQASGANAGSLHVQLLSFDFGAKAGAASGPAAATLPLGPWAVALWQELAEACGHDFEIRITGGLMVAESAAGMRFLEAKAALERRHGIDAEILGAGDLRRLAPALSEALVGAEHVALEGKINPLTATYSLLERAVRSGARFMRSTDVTGIERSNGRWLVATSRGTIRARCVVNAAGPWARRVAAMAGIDLPVYSAPLQMIVTEQAPALVDQLVAHADRHLSLKQLAAGGIVIGGAWPARYSEHQNLNVTVRESIEGNLWVAARVLPQLAGLHVLRTWAGMNVDIDGAPIIGEASGRPGFYNAVTSNGYTLAPAVARLSADLICRGRTDIDLSPFLLDRFDRGTAR